MRVVIPRPASVSAEMLTQRQIAERMAIFEQMGSVLTDERVEALANAGLVEPGIWQPWATGEGSVLVSLQKLTNQPQELLALLVALERAATASNAAKAATQNPAPGRD